MKYAACEVPNPAFATRMLYGVSCAACRTEIKEVFDEHFRQRDFRPPQTAAHVAVANEPSYLILSAADKAELENLVCEYVKAGYMPSAGVCVGGGLYAQAMMLLSSYASSVKQAVAEL